MGISVEEIPRIGDLLPTERRDLARNLKQLAKDNTLSKKSELICGLIKSNWPNRASLSAEELYFRLVEINWISLSKLNTDICHLNSFERIRAAGASTMPRMSEDEALLRCWELCHYMNTSYVASRDAQILRIALYGSSVRDPTADFPADIGDLDLGIDLQWTQKQLSWRQALISSGLQELLENGDERRAPSAALSSITEKYWKQRNVSVINKHGKIPAIIEIWCAPNSVEISSIKFDEELALEPALKYTDYPCDNSCLLKLKTLHEETLVSQKRARRFFEITHRF